jgi:hypothetical protein
VVTQALVSPDTTDLDRWIGLPVGGGQPADPVMATCRLTVRMLRGRAA